MSPAADSPPSTPTAGLTPKQVSAFWRDGFLIVPSYLSQQQCSSVLAKTYDLLHNLDLTNHPMTKFVTGQDGDGTRQGEEHVGDDYFLGSGDQVRFFFEEDAFNSTTGELCKPKEKAINKIGHNLHGLVSDFGQISHQGELGRRNAAVARDLGFRDPRLLQSMVICKQPEIGGAVPPHQDSTFLYTNRPSAVGFWIALEDAMVENGCLSFAPGSHRRAPIKHRFVRKRDGSGTEFEAITTAEQAWPRHFQHDNGDDGDDGQTKEEYVLGEVKAGDLVLIHGNILHKSERNVSHKGRMIYTFHLIEGTEHYDERNWLQVPGGPAAFTKLDGRA
ncbi:hypothetical protein DV737_g749, partial [Chaetothyriales sp. CBS 132003]